MAALVLLIGIVFIIVLGDWAMGKVDQFLYGCSFDTEEDLPRFSSEEDNAQEKSRF